MTFDGTNFTGTAGSNSYTISPETMRKYLTGAYYKIPDEVSEITVENSGQTEDFNGLGNTSDNEYEFRGVIDGNGKTIINKTPYPLIERSNGSVVKDLTIEVGSNISLAGTKNAFNSTEEDTAPSNQSYGAVIAKIFGGDNIIDNVSVAIGTESSKVTISLTEEAQLVPVGGYVGVVVNGGLIFRNMARTDENGNELLYDEDLFSNVTITAASQNAKSPGAAISDDNRAWLYVNPIVGRVINGYAVTESDKYRPYEDGTRTYQGGTTDEVRYWDEIEQKEVTTEPSSLSHVTMQNGTKHYSIADIDDKLTKLSASGSTITVPNGQAWFVMSLLVNSGESVGNLGFNQNYQMSRSDIFTGGLVGLIDRSNIDISGCHVYNIDLSSEYYAGGLVGHISTSPSIQDNNTPLSSIPLRISDVTVEKSSAYSGTPRIISNGNASGGFIGATKNDLSTDLILSNCIISDYVISSKLYTGGVTGVLGFMSDNERKFSYSIVLENFEISDCTLRADDSIGGLVGVINNVHQRSRKDKYYGSTAKNNQYLRGYNVLTKNLKFEPYTDGKHIYTNSEDLPSKTTTGIYEPFSVVFAGYICGFNEKAIQITGYSRQNDDKSITMLPDLVGYSGTMKRINSNNDMELTGKYDNPFGTYYNSTYNAPTGLADGTVDGYVIFADYDDKASTVQNKDHANMYACEDDVIGYSATGSKTIVTNYTVIAQKVDGESIIRNVTQNGDADVSTSETPSENPGTSVSGYKTGYEDVAMSVENMDQVSSVEELTADPTQGFYLQVNGYFITGVYTGNNGYFQKENSASNAILWYFEENSDNNTYRIYTYVGDEKKYLSRQFGKGGYISIYKDEAEGKNDNSSDHWDRDVSITCSQSLFTLQLLCSNHTQYTYFGTNGSYPINQTQNDYTKFKIYKSMTTEQLRVSDFSSTTFNTSSTEMSGTTSNSTAVNSTQQTEYRYFLLLCRFKYRLISLSISYPSKYIAS